MTIHQSLRAIAGAFVLISLALGYWVSPYWYLFTTFVGLNLFQSAFTDWCLMMTFLRKLGAREQKTSSRAPRASWPLWPRPALLVSRPGDGARHSSGACG
jgi:hypothetical protein